MVADESNQTLPPRESRMVLKVILSIILSPTTSTYDGRLPYIWLGDLLICNMTYVH